MFVIPVIASIPGIIFMALGLAGGGWEIVGYLMLGFIFLAGAGGALIGALVSFFLFARIRNKKIRDDAHPE